MTHRIEHDSMGELQVPEKALYGVQTQRAINNFPVSGLTMPDAFIRALGLIKICCAEANLELKMLDAGPGAAIIAAAEEVMAGKHNKHFPVDVFQTGSGTSSNMNVNEVIARLATRNSDYKIHPNDHVNMGQSSNDVIPTAVHVSAALRIHSCLLPALEKFAQTIERKAEENKKLVKTGRTHLMDAMPVTVAQELGGWARQIRNGRARIEGAMPRLLELAQGGTAVGTGINSPAGFAEAFCAHIKRRTKLEFRPKPDFFEALSSQDAAVEMSGQLRTLAVSIMKIANDLRWMNSGPIAGIGELTLPPLQPGSSIMPGKINPVIPEAAAMVCAQVTGNDLTIAIAGQSGNFQLNVMLPVVAYNLLQSIDLLTNSAALLADRCIKTLTYNAGKMTGVLDKNPILVTALNRKIGYDLGASIAKKAFAEGRPVLEVALEETDLSEEELKQMLDPAQLTQGGYAD